jgi:hypothetical protein
MYLYEPLSKHSDCHLYIIEKIQRFAFLEGDVLPQKVARKATI